MSRKADWSTQDDQPEVLDRSAIFTPTGVVSDFDIKLATHLRDLAFATFDILNHKQITELTLQYLSHDFTSISELPDHPQQYELDRDTHLASIHEWIAANPNMFCKILNCSVKLANTNRRATVWLTNVLGITGTRKQISLQRESVTILEWEKRADGWKCFHTKTIRGAGHVPDVVL